MPDDKPKPRKPLNPLPGGAGRPPETDAEKQQSGEQVSEEPKRPRIFLPASAPRTIEKHTKQAGIQVGGDITVTHSATPHKPEILSAYQMLKDAVTALPAMKYAQGVLGVICIIVIIGLFKLNLFFAALGVVILLGLMFGLLLFAIAAKQPHSVFKAPAIIMIWAFVLTMLGMVGLAVSCIFWKKPIDYPSLVAQFSTNPTAEYEQRIKTLTAEAQANRLAQDEVVGVWNILTTPGDMTINPNAYGGIEQEPSNSAKVHEATERMKVYFAKQMTKGNER